MPWLLLFGARIGCHPRRESYKVPGRDHHIQDSGSGLKLE